MLEIHGEAKARARPRSFRSLYVHDPRSLSHNDPSKVSKRHFKLLSERCSCGGLDDSSISKQLPFNAVIGILTKVEVVVLDVTDADKEDNQVNDSYNTITVRIQHLNPILRECVRTLASGVLAEVLGLVSAEETLSLDLGGGTSGELLVEADDTLHADSIRSSANGLWWIEFCQPSEFPS